MALNKDYLRQLFLVSLIITIASGLLFYIFPQYYYSLFPFLVLFFILSSLGIHYLLTTAAVKLKPQRFISHFMMVTGGKFFFYLIIMAVIAFNIPKSGIISFAISFFALYIIFSVIEVKAILKYLRSKSGK
jgi:hypothetical protein